ncbi:MAG: RraA family protein [Devosia sp.]|jgi:regulator of RNase E activity RraA|uniref:RraA family protein n=1 Tax=Devosia sp. TaxID=1871048 RepID=UPI001A511D48|nr:RraA family protein [Devosia sp.]MBL8599574.1 RraA family protein [Devosia sp.]
MPSAFTFQSRRNAPRPAGWETLFAALLSDSLDSLGIAHQVLSSRIRPLDDTLLMCGRARTGIYLETAYLSPDENPYELEIALVDDLTENDVVVLATGGSPRIAPWGGLLSTASKARGAAGCVTDGLIRDTAEIRRLGLPVYHRGIAPLDSKGRGAIREVDVPVFCDDVRIEPGDLIFGDADGVVVVPAKVEAQVLEIAFTKLKAEGHSMRELRAGSYLRDVYAKYGVL